MEVLILQTLGMGHGENKEDFDGVYNDYGSFNWSFIGLYVVGMLEVLQNMDRVAPLWKWQILWHKPNLTAAHICLWIFEGKT